MRQVAGAFYLKPGLSYDLIRSVDGERFGGRVDVIWSRATHVLQTWGNSANLGLEVNASLYWRTEGGPELIDGYHALLQYGGLFPSSGLGTTPDDPQPVTLRTAHNIRLLLGVQF